MLITPIELIISILTPSRCYLCNNEVDMLCDDCIEIIKQEPISRCYKCNKISKYNQVCVSCRTSSRLRRVWWLGDYEKVLKALVSKMKFGRKRSYARIFGILLSSLLVYIPEDTIVVPVPTASSRVRRRGFDQSCLIASTLANTKGLSYVEALTRTSQEDQIGKRRIDRFKQMQNSLTVKSKIDLTGKNILLVDDVLTSGATLEAAAGLLRSSGANHVDAVVVTRRLLQ